MENKIKQIKQQKWNNNSTYWNFVENKIKQINKQQKWNNNSTYWNFQVRYCYITKDDETTGICLDMIWLISNSEEILWVWNQSIKHKTDDIGKVIQLKQVQMEKNLRSEFYTNQNLHMVFK